MGKRVGIILGIVLVILVAFGAGWLAHRQFAPTQSDGSTAEKVIYVAKEGFPWEMVTAIGTAALALFTWWLANDARKGIGEQIAAQQRAQDQQFKEQRKAHSVDLVLNMGDRWESAKMLRARKKLCQGLLENDPDSGEPSRQILSFFESLGVIVKSAGINQYIVWSEFGWYVKGYYAALADGIKKIRERTKDKSFYEQFEWLNGKLLKIDAKWVGVDVANASPNSRETKEFLKYECELPLEPDGQTEKEPYNSGKAAADKIQAEQLYGLESQEGAPRKVTE